jgi:hypothetical protein
VIDRYRAERVDAEEWFPNYRGGKHALLPWDEYVRLTTELDYAYRAINYGFERGSFDFSVLKMRAEKHVAAAGEVRDE